MASHTPVHNRFLTSQSSLGLMLYSFWIRDIEIHLHTASRIDYSTVAYAGCYGKFLGEPLYYIYSQIQVYFVYVQLI